LKYESVKYPLDIVGKQSHVTNSSWTSSQFEKGGLSVECFITPFLKLL